MLERFYKGIEAMAMFSDSPEVMRAMGKYVSYLGSYWFSKNIYQRQHSYATLYELESIMNRELPQLLNNRLSSILDIRAVGGNIVNTPDMMNSGNVRMEIYFRTLHKLNTIIIYNLDDADLESDYVDYLSITMNK
jgi:hypothetical protein